jgi:NAD(P)-dependent dehydrogenase (short-subunit alcohol dehydrogenase family)
MAGTGNLDSDIARARQGGSAAGITYHGNAVTAESLAGEPTAGGAKVWTQLPEMSDLGSGRAARDRVVTDCGGVHGVACSADVPIHFGRLMDILTEPVERKVNVDVLGNYRQFRLVTPMLRARGTQPFAQFRLDTLASTCIGLQSKQSERVGLI